MRIHIRTVIPAQVPCHNCFCVEAHARKHGEENEKEKEHADCDKDDAIGVWATKGMFNSWWRGGKREFLREK